MATPRSRVYEVRTEFRAPMDFVLRWCTDYSSDDAKLEGEKFRRRVIERSRRRIVYEDLDETPTGWSWAHWTIIVHPPDHWHGDSVGSLRGWSIDYRLKPLPNGRTQFTMRGRRFPLGIGTKNPPKRELESDLAKNWRAFGRALEADYRKSLRAGARRRRHASART